MPEDQNKDGQIDQNEGGAFAVADDSAKTETVPLSGIRAIQPEKRDEIMPPSLCLRSKHPMVPLKQFVIPFMGLLLFVAFVLDLKVIPFFNIYTSVMTAASRVETVIGAVGSYGAGLSDHLSGTVAQAQTIKNYVGGLAYKFGEPLSPQDNLALLIRNISKFDYFVLSNFSNFMDGLSLQTSLAVKDSAKVALDSVHDLPRVATTSLALADKKVKDLTSINGARASLLVKEATRGAAKVAEKVGDKSAEFLLGATLASIESVDRLANGTKKAKDAIDSSYKKTTASVSQAGQVVDEHTTEASLNILRSAKTARIYLAASTKELQASVFNGLGEISRSLIQYQNDIVLAVYGGIKGIVVNINDANSKLVLGVWSGTRDIALSCGQIAGNIWSTGINFLADLSDTSVVAWKNFLGVGGGYSYVPTQDNGMLKDQIKQEIYDELKNQIKVGSTTNDATAGSGSSIGGMVVLPSTGSSTLDEAKKAQIKESFSDNVNVNFDPKSQTGIIRPVFRNTTGSSYMFVLTPLGR